MSARDSYQHTSNAAVDGPRVPAAPRGWWRRTDLGRLRVSGRDAASFLHALVTNDVEHLAVGRAVDAAYLTPQGRMITDMTICRRADDLIVAVPAPLAASLATRLDLLIFSEDVQIEDVSAALDHITCVTGVFDAVEEQFLPAGAPVDGFDGGALLDAAAVEALRIDAGRAKWGVDMNEETIPLEAGLLDRAISQTKGCYVGQEVIVRVLHRGHGRVAKRLMRIVFDDDARTVPAAGAPIVAAGEEVGRVTSAAFSPHRGRLVALGYVQRDHAVEGAAASIDGRAVVLAGFAT